MPSARAAFCFLQGRELAWQARWHVAASEISASLMQMQPRNKCNGSAAQVGKITEKAPPRSLDVDAQHTVPRMQQGQQHNQPKQTTAPSAFSCVHAITQPSVAHGFFPTADAQAIWHDSFVVCLLSALGLVALCASAASSVHMASTSGDSRWIRAKACAIDAMDANATAVEMSASVALAPSIRRKAWPNGQGNRLRIFADASLAAATVNRLQNPSRGVFHVERLSHPRR